MNDEYEQDWEPEEQAPPQTFPFTKVLKDKTYSNMSDFFTKFNGLFDRIYSNYARKSPVPALKEILYSFYDKMFTFQTKFVLIKGNNDYFLSPSNKSSLNEAFEAYLRRCNDFTDESPETTLKTFLRSWLSDPSNEFYLLRSREFLILLHENSLSQKLAQNYEVLTQAGLKKYSKMLKRKEGKKNDEVLRSIVACFEGKCDANRDSSNKSEKKGEDLNDFLGRKINVEEKRMRTLKEVFLHYCKDGAIPPANILKRNEFMNIGGFLAFLRDFKISNEHMSKPKTLEIFRKITGNLHESDFNSFVKILKKLSEFFYFNDLEKSVDAKFLDLLIFMEIDDRIKIKEKLSTFTDSKYNDLIAKQQKLKELNMSVIHSKQEGSSSRKDDMNKAESDDEEELKLEPFEKKAVQGKMPVTPKAEIQPNPKNNLSKDIEAIYKKLNPLNSAKYQNANSNNNRSKTKSPFRASKTDMKDKSISGTGTLPLESSKNQNQKNPNLMPIYFSGTPADVMKKAEKNNLYQKIFKRAQQIDLEEKLKDEERFTKLQSIQNEPREKTPTTIIKAKT